jgi:hypothetical protein
MAELVWLDDLVRLPPEIRHYANRIFYAFFWRFRIGELDEELYGPLLSTIASLFGEPSRPTGRQMLTGRMSYHQIPTIIQMLQNVTLNVRARLLGRDQVAGYGIMSSGQECIPDSS